MHLDDVRELKERAIRQVVLPMAVEAVRAHTLAVGAAQTRAASALRPKRIIALGIARRGGSREYALAVRLQRQSMLDRPELERLRKMAAGEVDVQFVGRIDKRATPWYQQRQRPLLIGCSVGHHKITAGTLGAFVRPVGAEDDALFVLSNNHVLANENRGKAGDAILQPGDLDGGTKPADAVASLARFVRLKKRGNLVDCAIARLEAGVAAKLRQLKGLDGDLKGVSPQAVDVGMRVRKVGRATGLSRCSSRAPRAAGRTAGGSPMRIPSARSSPGSTSSWPCDSIHACPPSQRPSRLRAPPSSMPSSGSHALKVSGRSG